MFVSINYEAFFPLKNFAYLLFGAFLANCIKCLIKFDSMAYSFFLFFCFFVFVFVVLPGSRFIKLANRQNGFLLWATIEMYALNVVGQQMEADWIWAWGSEG